jgi:hypothetical protein
MPAGKRQALAKRQQENLDIFVPKDGYFSTKL